MKKSKKEYFVREYAHERGRLIVSYSRKRAKKTKNERERILKRLKGKMKKGEIKITELVKNSGVKKYLKISGKKVQTGTLNEEKVAFEERWDGIYGVITNCQDSNLSGEEILEEHRGLWQIESAFRANKHDLKMRPIYHRNSDRIRSHILICFIAYALLSTVRYKLKKANINLSMAKIKEELTDVQGSIVRDRKTKKRFLIPSKITENQQKIYQAMGQKLDSRPRIII